MKTDPRNLAVSHLWLFAAHIDPQSSNVDGQPLAQSLAALMQQKYDEGRAEAAQAFLKLRDSDTYRVARHEPGEQTGRYDLNQLNALLAQVS